MTSGSICEAQRAPSPHQNGPIVQLRGTSGPLPRHTPSHVEQECVHLAVCLVSLAWQAFLGQIHLVSSLRSHPSVGRTNGKHGAFMGLNPGNEEQGRRVGSGRISMES